MPPNDSQYPAQPPETFDKARFWRLLGGYFIGIAIGCVLVGLILSAKQRFAPRPAPSAPQTTTTPAPPAPPPAPPMAPTTAPPVETPAPNPE